MSRGLLIELVLGISLVPTGISLYLLDVTKRYIYWHFCQVPPRARFRVCECGDNSAMQ